MTEPVRPSTTLLTATVGVSALVFVLTSCQVIEQASESSVLTVLTESLAVLEDEAVDGSPGEVEEPVVEAEQQQVTALGGESDAQESIDFYSPGSGIFVSAGDGQGMVGAGDGDVTLNFENTNLIEVVQVILGDLLGANYVIDSRVQGTVTLQTSRALPKDALLPTLEMLLRSNGAAVAYDSGLFHVVPMDSALKGLVSPQLGDSSEALPSGYRVIIVPLRHIAAREMHKILEPFTITGNIVRVDFPRNLLVLAGAAPELRNLIETIEVFDVDWLSGMSVALFTPDHVNASTLAKELNSVFGDSKTGPYAGALRFVELERLNALLVITPVASYLHQVKKWVDRLDKDIGEQGRRLYVYHVQNGKAVDLAAVLTQVFEDASDEDKLPATELAPGFEPVQVSAPSLEDSQLRDAEPEQTTTDTLDESELQRISTSVDEGLELSEQSSVRIIADEVNNALLIMATSTEFEQVQAALKRLDIPPLQVLIETTIAEISLTGDLRYGLEWFFKNNVGDDSVLGTLDLGAASIGALAPGFSYALTDNAGSVRAVLNALASDSRVNVLSSPSLMVLNNQTSTINVGDEVPVTTQQQQATSGNSTVVNNIEFRDTGVLLTVSPRVNAGGLVTMEIEQEVSNVAPGTDADSLTPTIQQRRITSVVAVQSGRTVVLGGLIRENKTQTHSGIPVLYKLPVIGGLFGTQDNQESRTELVVLMTPLVIRNANEASAITREYREKMESLKPLE